ncbi:hypothetical protein ACJMK2_011295 [Sinanodonta woodiana]|uniref:Uncharacterized protein n=1 Tax=Sinanodonta woodiana TaxID=1069815 RepID=A0ABD3V4L5_SINWO
MYLFLLAPTDLQEVWLKDVTTKFQTDKRTLSHRVLGDELTFRLMQGSHYLTLNLKRNYGIDPNADIYVVQKSNDGRYQPHKTHHLDGEDLAYYQDVENGAYVTVRCIERSNGQCDRVIKGNIRIGDRNYDLQPADTDVTSRDVLDVPELFGRRYVLHDQENRGVVNVNEINVDQQLVDLTRRVPDRQRQRDRFPLSDTMLSSRHRADAYKSARKGENSVEKQRLMVC